MDQKYFDDDEVFFKICPHCYSAKLSEEKCTNCGKHVIALCVSERDILKYTVKTKKPAVVKVTVCRSCKSVNTVKRRQVGIQEFEYDCSACRGTEFVEISEDLINFSSEGLGESLTR